MRPDPPVRDRCPCGKPRHPERSYRYGKAESDRDPFCSTSCCRKWHGTSLPVSSLSRFPEEEDAA